MLKNQEILKKVKIKKEIKKDIYQVFSFGNIDLVMFLIIK